MAEGTEFTVDIAVPSGGIASAADEVSRLASSLEAAGAASTAAEAAVKAGEAAYKAAEATANKAALAVEKIGLAAAAQEGKVAKALEVGDLGAAVRAQIVLEKLTARQAEAASKATAAQSALAGEAAALDKLKSSAAQAADAEDKISKAHKQASDAAKATDKSAAAANAAFGKTSELAEGFGKLGGPLGSLGQKAFGAAEGFKKLGSSAGAAGPYIAVAIVFIAMATAIAAATIALTAYAIKLGDANRSQSLLYAGITQSADGGAALEAHIDRLAGSVPQSTEKLRSMAAELAKTGLRGEELADALDAAATKAAEAEFGPEWAKQVNSISKQTELFQRNLSKLFGGLKLEGVLDGFAKLVGLFDATSATGKAIKVVFDDLMQPIIDGLDELIPLIVKTFIQFEIWALRALIAIKPYGPQIEFVAKALALAAAVIVGVVVVALVSFAAAITWVVTLLGFFTMAGAAVVEAFIKLGKSALDVVSYLSGLSLSSIGGDMITGLAKGITDSADQVLKAMTGAVGGAVDGAKKLLGIASPSKVFAEIGMNTAAGMVEGVDGSAADVQGAMAAMVNPPASPDAAAATPSAPAGGGKNFSGAQFIFHGVKDAKDAVDMFLAAIEGGVDQLGGGVPT